MGIDPGEKMGLVVTDYYPNEGWKVRFRTTYLIQQPPPNSTNLHYAQQIASFFKDPEIAGWVATSDKIIIERQFTTTGALLNSHLMMNYLVAVLEYQFPGKAVLLGSNTVKSFFFSSEEKRTYSARKKAATVKAETAFESDVLVNRPGESRLHDESDAYLLICAYLVETSPKLKKEANKRARERSTMRRKAKTAK